MSGNYDYPPASRRTSRGNRGERPPRPNANRLQHLRDLLNSERNRNTSARALETLNREINEHRSSRVRDRPSFEQTRDSVDRQLQQHLSRPEDRPHAGHDGHLHPGSLGLQPLNLTVLEPDLDVLTARRPAVREGARISRGINYGSLYPSALLPGNLLDDPVPPIETPPVMPQEADGDRDNDQCRVKRRKLESDDSRERVQTFRYGHQGQVVPGPLNMELVSCDGGTYEPGSASSWPSNILRNDSSVYCTKSDRCNLVLKHHGEGPFCLKKIVIKAPRIGYDAPIQEGMVFVSMTCDELLGHTAQHNIRYPSPRNRRSTMQPSQEYLNAYRTPLQALERTPLLANPETHSESEAEANQAGRLNPDAHEPMPQFRVTTDYDEQSGNNDSFRLDHDEELPSITQIERLQMDHMEDDLLCSDSEESESDDDATTSMYSRRRRELQRRVRMMRQQYAMEREGIPRRRPVPSLIQPATSTTASGSQSSSDTPNSTPRLLKPHARFFIERSKSMVSIKFDPPPSGRFVLIKLWSPRSGGNIDIQSIVAHGFAGPRFFPASGFR